MVIFFLSRAQILWWQSSSQVAESSASEHPEKDCHVPQFLPVEGSSTGCRYVGHGISIQALNNENRKCLCFILLLLDLAHGSSRRCPAMGGSVPVPDPW